MEGRAGQRVAGTTSTPLGIGFQLAPRWSRHRSRLLVVIIAMIPLTGHVALGALTCQADVQGANDQPGQKDLTEFCIDLGNGSPYDLTTSWSWDLVALPGGNTGDACSLYDTNANGLANLAICVTIRGGGSQASLGAVRLFTCGDSRPDRCTSPVQLAVNKCGGTGAACLIQSDCVAPAACIPDPTRANTVCTVSRQNTDPFPTGESYPADTAALCLVDLNDFGVSPGTTSLVDTCSYPSTSVNSDPSDCITFRGCSTNAQCNDGNSCTNDVCNTSGGFCTHVPNTGAACSDGNACTIGDVCSSVGVCTAGSPLDCNDSNVCTNDSCNPATGCVHVPNTGPCNDNDACTVGDICGGGICHGGPPPDCNDNNPCTDDSCDSVTGCKSTNNTAPCDDGNACTTGDTCGGGTCHGGPPPNCDDLNPCTTDSCNPTTGCVNTNNTLPCNDGNACTTGDTCGEGTCHGGPPPNCDDFNACTDDSCDPLTGCGNANNTDPCDDGNTCTTNDTCDGGVCHGGPPPDCNDLNPCTNDSCNSTTGCVHEDNTLPCDDGDACTTADTCGGGTCNGGPPLDCEDFNPCTDDSCDPFTGCVNTSNTDPCDDGNACTTGDTCGGGTCHGGPPPDCDDLNPCTTDSCDPTGGCVNTNNTLPCNDGNACTTGDACGEGTCNGGPPLNCDDQNLCTDDSCDPVTGCVNVHNTDPCDDGNACTIDDVCAGGMCIGTQPPDCDDDNPCTDDSCDPLTECVHINNTLSCDDGDACTTGDACGEGTCNGGPAPNCDDFNACTDDSCDPLTGCVNANNAAPCDDGNACTTNDTCDGGVCHGGPPPDCDDLNPCTDDLCNPATGCVHENNTLPCDDGDACTTADTCGGGTCNGGPPLDCEDFNSCSDDSCDPLTGCVNANNTDPCDDGNACTTDDTCGGGICHGGPPPNCDDLNPCTTDSCDPTSGCVNTSNTLPCNDDNACTTGDTCGEGTCNGGPPPDCDDLNPCTTDSCDPTSGCVNTNNTAPCHDGNACTTGDTCSGGTCHGGPLPDCDDLNPCTTDSCDPTTGCVNTSNTLPCNDDNACTTGDSCGEGTCNGGPPPICNDNNLCTDDLCNPSTGCLNINNTAPCSDGNACTTDDVCGGGGCLQGAPVVCESDGRFCNGTELCDPGTGACVSSGDPCGGLTCCEDQDACFPGGCPIPQIPTTSAWGLLIMALLLFSGAKVYFGGRGRETAYRAG